MSQSEIKPESAKTDSVTESEPADLDSKVARASEALAKGQLLKGGTDPKNYDLTAQASQTGFARLLGCSQQSISRYVQSGVLTSGGSYHSWLKELHGHLSEVAAGRGADHQNNMAQATIEEKTAKTALYRLQYHEKLGSLVNLEEAQSLLTDWASYANRKFTQSVEEMVTEIEQQHGIKISPELREKHAGTATERIRNFVGKLIASAEDGSGAVPTGEALPD
ncbi:hypothetical protein [Oceanospirillum sediminis]|uniref:Terminase small subunit n=1 Tax=Oceanospirillum sediminis TaxID=2760088 RepID=A0A839IUR0_9GAMM|nr:hypothetical protein [Oceanospirillum sediminis]MBB1489085.1 hypothetical protein [Oceanospirillum sediminis]